MSGKKNNRYVYNIINAIVLLGSISWFIYENRDSLFKIGERSAAEVIALLVTVAFVHIVKATRLYVSLYGTNIVGREYIKTYCKVTPVSMILPYKSGEIFRMYCYGYSLSNYLKGIIIILLDRFMDTMGLLTALLLVWMVVGGGLSSVVYIILVFLCFIMVLYLIFPGVYKFWKNYLLCANASRKKIAILKFIEKVDTIYEEIGNVTRGRGIILYILSIVAWVIEIGGYTIQLSLKKNSYGENLTSYLLAAIGVGHSNQLNMFIMASVMMMMILYVIEKISELIYVKRGM